MKKLITFVFLTVLTQGDVALSQWQLMAPPGESNNIINCLTEFDGKLYAGTSGIDSNQFGGALASTDDGMTWTIMNYRLGVGPGGQNGVKSLVVMGDLLFAGTSNSLDTPNFNFFGVGFYYTTNGGEQWLQYGEGASSEVILAVCGDRLFEGQGPYTMLTIYGDYYHNGSDSDFQVLIPTNGYHGNNNSASTWTSTFAVNGTSVVAGLHDGGVYFSSDTGDTWHNVSKGLPYDDNSSISALAMIGGNVFAGLNTKSRLDTANGIYRSNNSGANWAPINKGLTDTAINSLLSYEGNLFAGTNTGVFLSTNSGDSWQNLNGEGEQNFDAQALCVHDGYLFAGGNDELWRLPLSELNLSGVESTASNVNTTLRVFPNPASGDLQIMGGEAGEVRLFDLMGRERMNAGTNGSSATLDVSHLEAGMYFLRLGGESAKVEIAR